MHTNPTIFVGIDRLCGGWTWVIKDWHHMLCEDSGEQWGFYENSSCGYSKHPSREAAVHEAKEVAKAEGIPFEDDCEFTN